MQDEIAFSVLTGLLELVDASFPSEHAARRAIEERLARDLGVSHVSLEAASWREDPRLAGESCAAAVARAIDLLLDRARARAGRQELEARVRRSLRESFDLDRTLASALEGLGQALGVSRAHVALPEASSPGAVRVTVEWRDPPERASAIGWVFARPDRPAATAARATPDAVTCHDVLEDPRFGSVEVNRPGDYRAFVLVPFRAGALGEGGLLVAECERARRWTDDEVRFVQSIAEHCAIAVERARMFDDARRRAEELELLVSHMHEGVMVCSPDLKVLRMNEAAQRMVWGPPIDSKSWGQGTILVHDASGRLLSPAEYPIVRAARDGEVVSYSELLLRHGETGEERLVTCTATPLRDGSGKLFAGIAVFRDVTEQRAAARHASRTEKFRVLGELAASVAHELNNVLAAVLGRAEVIIASSDETATRRNAEVIAAAARDATHVLGRLTRLGQQKARTASPGERVDLRSVAADAIELTRSRWARPREGRAIEVALAAPQEALLVRGVAAELREVVTNLILNAVDALPHGGRIALTLERQGDQATLTVFDDGIGMTDDVLQHAFEPFFTTKGEAGTGLGLNISSAIATAHGGRITARSAPGKGTTIVLELPLVDEDATPRQPGRKLAASKRILVVDDDDRVRSLLADVLAAEGHDVTSASSGEEALATIDGDARAFDVLVSDVAMPGMSGVVLAEEVKARRPQVAVVLVSGWAASAPAEALARLGAALVTKPFATDDVRRAVAAALALA